MAQVIVTLDMLHQTVARVLATYPAERGRIERGATLITLGHVEQAGPDAFEVRSQTDAGVTYTVTNDGCGCVDAQRHPGQACKHVWSVNLLLVAQERQRRLDAREHLSADELARLIAWKRERSAVAA
jgi:hypothetical protein